MKAIFFDIDGTLLSGTTGTIPQSAQRALWAAHEKGYLLFLSTGRHPLEIAQAPGIDRLPFSGVVSMNGQYCYCGPDVIHADALPVEDVNTLAAFLENAPYAALYARADGQFITKLTPEVQAVCDSIGTHPAEMGSLADMASGPILQAGLFLGTDPVPQVVEDLPGCHWTRWHIMGIDISPKNGGKWMGVEKMARHFGIDPAHVMTVGDNDNDVDMLKRAGYSVAMGNGTHSAKSAAHCITASVDEGGIARVLENLPAVEQC